MSTLFHAILFVFLLSAFSCEGFVSGKLLKNISAQPGADLDLVIPLINKHDCENTLSISVSDFVQKQDHVLFETAPHHPRSIVEWISFPTNQVVLSPQEKKDFHYRVHIPNVTELQGSYWAVFLIEPAMTKDEIPCEESNENPQFSLKSKIRYAYVLVINVGAGKNHMKTIYKDLSADQYIVDIQNDGECMSRAKMSSDWYDSKGLLISKLESSQKFLLPGDIRRFSFPTTSIPSGTYTVMLLLDQGDDGIFGDRVLVTIPHQDASP